MGKYLIFDGNDVIGPFSPKELSEKEGFSSISLICPDSESTQSNKWQTASSFPDFTFDHDGKLVSVKEYPQEEETTPVAASEDTLTDVLEGTVQVGKNSFEAVEPFDTFRLKSETSQETSEGTPVSKEPEQQELVVPSRKKARFMLLIVFILLIMGGIIVSSHYLTDLSNQKREQEAKKVAIKKAQAAVKKQEYVPTSPVISVKPSTNQDPNIEKALSIAQHYWLPTKKSTVISYLTDAYKEQFAKGYTETWSAEPLHKSTYIVKYRLAKPRLEPIVYMFQVDVSNGKVTGALNNIAIDLIGKI